MFNSFRISSENLNTPFKGYRKNETNVPGKCCAFIIKPDVDVDKNNRKPFVLHFSANKNIIRSPATIKLQEFIVLNA